MKKPISKAKRPVKSEDDQIVRFSLELEGEDKELFLALKRASRVANNADVARMALTPGVKIILQKFESENTAVV